MPIIDIPDIHHCYPPRQSHVLIEDPDEPADFEVAGYRYRVVPDGKAIGGAPYYPLGSLWQCDECSRVWEVSAPQYLNQMMNEWRPVGRLIGWYLLRKALRKNR